MFEKYPDVVDVKTAAQMLHTGKKSIYALLKNGEINHRKIGRVYRIPKEFLISYLRKNS